MQMEHPLREAYIPQVIRTERLTLRPPRIQDVGPIDLRYASDPRVAHFMPWRSHSSIGETDRFLRSRLQSWARREPDYAWIITRADDEDVPLGMIELHARERRGTLGYCLATAEWGRGYATEAARSVADIALAQPGIFRVWAWCDTEHVASCRVLEKIGMQREATFRRHGLLPALAAEPRDVYCYARTRG